MRGVCVALIGKNEKIKKKNNFFKHFIIHQDNFSFVPFFFFFLFLRIFIFSSEFIQAICTWATTFVVYTYTNTHTDQLKEIAIYTYIHTHISDTVRGYTSIMQQRKEDEKTIKGWKRDVPERARGGDELSVREHKNLITFINECAAVTMFFWLRWLLLIYTSNWNIILLH